MFFSFAPNPLLNHMIRRARGKRRKKRGGGVQEEIAAVVSPDAGSTRLQTCSDYRASAVIPNLEEEEQKDREGRLEEFQLYWNDYLEEASSATEAYPPELVLSQLELNRLCIKFLITQTQHLPPEQRPKKLILNSCKYNPNDGTAQLLVKYFTSSCSSSFSDTKDKKNKKKSSSSRKRPNHIEDDGPNPQPRLLELESIRLESAYVGHLPSHTASALLHGLPLVGPSLKSVQLVDLDLRPLAPKVAAVMWSVPSLELRHCRVDVDSLTAMGFALGKQLQSLHFHACVLDDALWSVFCRAMMEEAEGDEFCSDDTSDGPEEKDARKPLRHLALPSNRLTVASVPTLTDVMLHQDGLETLDLQRMQRLFFLNGAPENQSVRAMHAALLYRENILEALVRPFCQAVQNHLHLLKLDLSRCGVTDAVATCLFQALSEQQQCSHGLQKLLLGGNADLSLAGEWIGLLPRLSHLRHLDLPKHAAGHVAWYYHESVDNPPHLTWLAKCLQNTNCLHSITHDGTSELYNPAIPSAPEALLLHRILQRNQTMHYAQRALSMLGTQQQNHSAETSKNNHAQNNKLWPRVLQHCARPGRHGSMATYTILSACFMQWCSGATTQLKELQDFQESQEVLESQ